MTESKIDATQEELWRLRALIQRIGWGEFMRDVAGLLAEQSDKTTGDQGRTLKACSKTIRTLDIFFKDCGTFDYSAAFPEIPKEFEYLFEVEE